MLLAGAVQAAVFRTGRACSQKSLTEGCARTMDTDSGV
jgi:hypothetical protein